MNQKLNVRELLKGTDLESDADVIATKLELWQLDYPDRVANMARHGKIHGHNPAVIASTILAQYEKRQAGQVLATAEEPEPAPELEPEPAPVPDWVKATQPAIELAAEEGVNLDLVVGTGKDGAILKSDVVNFLEEDNDNDD